MFASRQIEEIKPEQKRGDTKKEQSKTTETYTEKPK